MTKLRNLVCNEKHCPHEKILKFNDWMRVNLPSSNTGYSISDLDVVLWNYKHKKIMFLEIKTKMNYPSEGQKIMWSNIDKWIKKGIDNNWTYCGFRLIQFENYCFDDGKCYINSKEITEEELIKYLSFEI